MTQWPISRLSTAFEQSLASSLTTPIPPFGKAKLSTTGPIFNGPQPAELALRQPVRVQRGGVFPSIIDQ